MQTADSTQVYTLNWNCFVISSLNAYYKKSLVYHTCDFMDFIAEVNTRAGNNTSFRPIELLVQGSDMPENVWLQSFKGYSKILHPENGNFQTYKLFIVYAIVNWN